MCVYIYNIDKKFFVDLLFGVGVVYKKNIYIYVMYNVCHLYNTVLYFLLYIHIKNGIFFFQNKLIEGTIHATLYKIYA